MALVWKKQCWATAEELASQKTSTSQLSQLAVELVGDTLKSVFSLTPQSQPISLSLPDHLVSATLQIDQSVQHHSLQLSHIFLSFTAAEVNLLDSTHT